MLGRTQFQQSYPYSLPPPVNGWNATGAITSMSPKDAIVLDNLFPREQEIELRKGMTSFATLPATKTIKSLLPYVKGNGSVKLFAAAADGFYDVTSGGAVASADEVMSNNLWESVNITTSGGSYLFAVCGDATNSARHYDGSTWATPSITGVASNLFTKVALHKGRLWFVERN